MSETSFYAESPFILQPHFSISAPLALDGYQGGTAVNIPDEYSAADNFAENTTIEKVQVQIRDDGGNTTSVTTVGGGTWSRNEGATPKFSYLVMTMPEPDDSNQVSVVINTGGATRNQVIIIRRVGV